MPWPRPARATEGTWVNHSNRQTPAREAISIGVVAPGKMMIQFAPLHLHDSGHHKEELVDSRPPVAREEFIVPWSRDIAGTNAAGSLTKWYRDKSCF